MSERDSTLTDVNYDYFFKIVLVGDCGVGKTNILTSFTRKEFNLQSKSTIGVEMASRILEGENDKLIKAEVWDTAGQEKFQSLMKSYYRAAVGALLVYDITKSSTFENIGNWYKQVKEEAGPDCKIILIGNKADMDNLRQVSIQEAQIFAKAEDISFIETSAYDGKNIELAFQTIFQEIQEYYEEENMDLVVNHNQRSSKLENKSKKPSSCCGRG